MPIYEYECPTHGRYEVSQRITEAALTKCTFDGCTQPIRKLISATSFALKGSGWYATDYAKSGSNTETKSEAKPAAKTESKPDAKTESKPDTTAASPAKTDSPASGAGASAGVAHA